MPDNHVLVLDRFIPVHHVLETSSFQSGLIGEFASAPEVSIAVLGHPKVVLSKLGPLGNDTLGVSQEQLPTVRY